MNTELSAFRRELHVHPELSGHEHETQKRIRAFLKSHGIHGATDVGKTGLLYRFEFGEGPRLLVRVDTDALPIQEINDFEHRSGTEGVSHKCGHDGHTTIGAGLAMHLKDNPLKAGSVDIIFQPAEEIGEGARAVLADVQFDAKRYDHAVALHNIPGAPMHQVLCRTHSFTPAVHSLIIRLQGKTSHAAQPLKGHNPAYALAEITALAQGMEETDELHADYNLITPVYSCLGSKDYGISAGYGELHFTIRSWEQQRVDDITQSFSDRVLKIAHNHQLEVETELVAVFAANQNDPFVVEQVQLAAVQLDLSYVDKREPFPWGEDFGLFTQHIKGAMFGLGSGESTPALHNPDYDYPDEITETGIHLFYEIAKHICER